MYDNLIVIVQELTLCETSFRMIDYAKIILSCIICIAQIVQNTRQ